VKIMVIASLLSSGTATSSLVDQVQTLIFLLIVTLVVALFSRLLRVPYTLLLVIVGFVVGLLPFLPHEHIDPNLVFYVFIPALLFEGAWNAELGRLEANWLPIVLLAIPGMVLSLLAVAVILHFGIGMAWLLALLVGADVWEFINYLANSLLFLLLGFELALSNLVQSFPGIFFGLLGVLIGRVLMIYVFIPLQDVLARWWAQRTSVRPTRLPRPRPVLSAWRPVMVLSGLRGALSLALVLSLPTALEQRDLLTDIVYGVILVTLLGQGLTLRVLLPLGKRNWYVQK
jgi:NhaP-type Na+/H+ or K+/H+ antiporter